jgi:hypothetical protein
LGEFDADPTLPDIASVKAKKDRLREKQQLQLQQQGVMSGGGGHIGNDSGSVSVKSEKKDKTGNDEDLGWEEVC